MVTGASTADLRRDPGRRAQGRAHPDAPPQLPRVAARHPPRRAGGQQDGPRRLLAGACSTRSRRDYRAFAARDRPRRTSRASRCRRCAATTSSSPATNTPWYDGPTLMELPRDGRGRRGRACSRAVPHAGAVGQPARTSTSAASPARSPAARCAPGDRVARRCRRGATSDGRAHRHLRRRPRRGRRRPVGHAHARPTRSTSAAAT